MVLVAQILGGVVFALFAVFLIAYPEELIRTFNAGTKPGSWRSVKTTPGGVRAIGIIFLALAIGGTVVALIPAP